MIPRYQSSVMKQLWSDENKYATWFLVERRYLCVYLKEKGAYDDALINRLENAASRIDWRHFSERVSFYDDKVKHDVIAFLHALEEELHDDARLIHTGLTSSDIVDTSFGLLLTQAHGQIIGRLKTLIRSLWKQACVYRGVMCLGRTHGQAAEPMTFGIKLLSHVCELLRGHERLKHAARDIACGKLSGAVGVYAHTTPGVEARTLEQLGLSCETVSTQIVARDRHAYYFSSLAVLAGSIERFATEIRLLMHGQTKEAFEPFSTHQKGSSAMPHKKNPVLSENLCGLMRMMRAFAMSALENQALWHERDISHSSVERIIAPDATSLMEFALARLTMMVDELVVDKERLQKNLDDVGDVLSSQALMLALVDRGLLRQQAYELVQAAALRGTGDFQNRLCEVGIEEKLGIEACERILQANKMVGYEHELFARVERSLKLAQI